MLEKGKPFGLFAVLASATALLVAPGNIETPGEVAVTTSSPLTMITMIRPLSATVSAGDQRCTGTLPAGTYDNIVVPEGQTCRVTGSHIRGNIKVLPGATLDARENTIQGSVQGDKPDFMELWRNTIDGNLESVEAAGTTANGALWACGNTLTSGNIAVEKSRNGTIQIRDTACSSGNVLRKGNLFLQENNVGAGFLNVSDNLIEEGNLQVFKNKGGFQKLVQRNVVSNGVIQCKENKGPFIGTPNAGRADPPPNQCTGGPLP
jgi:hypothetical protein